MSPNNGVRVLTRFVVLGNHEENLAESLARIQPVPSVLAVHMWDHIPSHQLSNLIHLRSPYEYPVDGFKAGPAPTVIINLDNSDPMLVRFVVTAWCEVFGELWIPEELLQDEEISAFVDALELSSQTEGGFVKCRKGLVA